MGAGRGLRVAFAVALVALAFTSGVGRATATVGKPRAAATAGASWEALPSNVKQVNRYAVPMAVSLARLRIMLAPNVANSPSNRRQQLRGLVYADTGGHPGTLLGVSRQLTFASGSSTGWYNLVFRTPVTLAAGNYWVGVISGTSSDVAAFRFKNVTGSRDYNINRYAAGPTTRFGGVRSDAKQISLSATYAPVPSPPAAPPALTLPGTVSPVSVVAEEQPAPGPLPGSVPPPPADTGLPAISGTAQQGRVLTASAGTWTNEPTAYSYQWQRCEGTGPCSTIAGATGHSYTPSAADVTRRLEVLVVASNAGGSSAGASSEPTAAVLPERPVNTVAPTISGTAQQGKALTSTTGTWANEPTSYSYQWLRCEKGGGGCAVIAGAASKTYMALAADIGHTLKASVGATNAGGSGEPVSSEASATVLPEAPVNTTLPAVSGIAEQGQTLATTNGGWTSEPTGYSYQWLRCDSSVGNCGPISSATSHSYTLSSADVGSKIRSEVIASNAGGASKPARSEATGTVQPPPHHDPVLAAVGDIACPNGDTEHSCKQLATATLTAGFKPDAVAVLGDNQYESGTLSEFYGTGAYNDTWGQFNSIVHPAPGNHEYHISPSGYFTYFGASAGSGNYSYNLGSWHVISLNSDCSDLKCGDSLAGTTSTAAVEWLEEDLAAHPGQCTLAYWHHPRFTSGFVGNSTGVAPFWKALYAAHADVVLNGHDHMYERFAPQDPSAHPTSAGIREFVAGTGGESLLPIGEEETNLEKIENTKFGVLFLTLRASSYEWAFRTTDGSVFDTGSTQCHAGAEDGSSPVRATTAIVGGGSTQTLKPSVPAAGRLARTATRNRPFVFEVHRAPSASTSHRSLPLEVHCSRGCDVTITLRARGTVLATYRETETQITHPYSLLSLPLSPETIRLMDHAGVTAGFLASDATGEQRSETLRLAGR
jgi:hypothetical protein